MPEIRGTITVAIGDALEVVEYTATSFEYQERVPECPSHLVLTATKGPEKNHTGPSFERRYGSPVTPGVRPRLQGWRVHGISRGVPYGDAWETHDANPRTAIARWFARANGIT